MRFFYTIIIMLSASIAFATGDVETTKRVTLKDGSVLFGKIESSENDSRKTVRGEFGELVIDNDQIESERPAYEKFSIYEKWELRSIAGEAEGIIRIKLPESSRAKYILPIIESRYKATVTEVRSFDGDWIPFLQLDRGPITLLELKKGDLDRDDEFILVKLECSNALEESEHGRFLRRSFTSDLGGMTNITITTSENVSLRFQGERLETHSFHEKTLRHEERSYEVEVVESATE